MMLGQLREDRIRKTTCLPRIKKVKPIYVNILSKGAEEIHYKQKNKKKKWGGETTQAPTNSKLQVAAFYSVILKHSLCSVWCCTLVI